MCLKQTPRRTGEQIKRSLALRLLLGSDVLLHRRLANGKRLDMNASLAQSRHLSLDKRIRRARVLPGHVSDAQAHAAPFTGERLCCPLASSRTSRVSATEVSLKLRSNA